QRAFLARQSLPHGLIVCAGNSHTVVGQEELLLVGFGSRSELEKLDQLAVRWVCAHVVYAKSSRAGQGCKASASSSPMDDPNSYPLREPHQKRGMSPFPCDRGQIGGLHLPAWPSASAWSFTLPFKIE